MTALRSALYHLSFYIWALIMGWLFVPLLVLPRPVMRKAGYVWSWGALKLLLWTTGLGYRVEGLEHLPKGPVLIAAKHQSACDTLMMPVIFPKAMGVVKKELLLIPFYGWYVKKIGMIGIDRTAGAAALRRLIADVRKALAEGDSVFMFPEGTRTAPGDPPDYQAGIAALYTQIDVPVVPVALNSGLFWSRRAFAKRSGTITVRILPPIPGGLERREFMARLEHDIETATAELVSAEAQVIRADEVPRFL